MGSFPEMYNDPVGIITTLLKETLSESNIKFSNSGILTKKNRK